MLGRLRGDKWTQFLLNFDFFSVDIGDELNAKTLKGTVRPTNTNYFSIFIMPFQNLYDLIFWEFFSSIQWRSAVKGHQNSGYQHCS